MSGYAELRGAFLQCHEDQTNALLHVITGFLGVAGVMSLISSCMRIPPSLQVTVYAVAMLSSSAPLPLVVVVIAVIWVLVIPVVKLVNLGERGEHDRAVGAPREASMIVQCESRSKRGTSGQGGPSLWTRRAPRMYRCRGRYGWAVNHTWYTASFLFGGFSLFSRNTLLLPELFSGSFFTSPQLSYYRKTTFHCVSH